MRSERKTAVTRWLNNNRAPVMLAAVFTLMSLSAPRFLSVDNVTTILNGACLNGIAAIGFTLIFILGRLDLSIGAVVMLCGMLTIGLQPSIGWPGSIGAALLAGCAVGVVNGLLVVKARINAFIVTLGTMTIVMGLMYLYSGGGSKNITDWRFADWLTEPVLPLLTPMVLVTILLVAATQVVLKFTRVGRNLVMVGGNAETAWLAGLNRDRYLIAGFLLCGLYAAIAGSIFAAGLSTMTSEPTLGMRTLLTVLAAVIIGGTTMTGGKGSVLNSYFAVLMLTTLFNGIWKFGWGFEVQIFVNGLILALVVLYEAYAIYRHELLKGLRPDLVKEVEAGWGAPVDDSEQEEGEDAMHQKDRLPLICLTIVAVVGIVAITAMYFHHASGRGGYAQPANTGTPAASEVDVYTLCGTDNQPYVVKELETPVIPPRPQDPAALPKTDAGHWWDIEYAGWKVEKTVMPESPGDGPAGKLIVLLRAGDHPYWTAYLRGFNALAKAYGFRVKSFSGNWNIDLQSQQTDLAISERPDMIILAPVDTTACTPLLRRINKAGIPCITSNTIPCNEAMRYCLAWTGPDDWGQMRMLARVFADAMDKKGGYAIVRHMPGSSPFFSRTFAPVSELGTYAPDMELLAMDTSNLKMESTMQLVGAWLTKFGDELKGLVLAGDGFALTGALEALRKANRTDVIIVAAGNCKTGMDAVKDGQVLAISYQSAEGDGASCVHAAAEWFQGRTLEPVRYLRKHIITQKDVDDFMPAQW